MFQVDQAVEPFDPVDVIVIQIDLLESGQLRDIFDLFDQILTHVQCLHFRQTFESFDLSKTAGRQFDRRRLRIEDDRFDRCLLVLVLVPIGLLDCRMVLLLVGHVHFPGRAESI